MANTGLGPAGLRASPLVVFTWFSRVDQSLQSLITNEHVHLPLHLYVTFLFLERILLSFNTVQYGQNAKRKSETQLISSGEMVIAFCS